MPSTDNAEGEDAAEAQNLVADEGQMAADDNMLDDEAME